ncbi:DUF3127 domain-containing protein [Leeuwenhoekiella sp. MAR_2009_132]|uniref:DUF3127 domain-containing protein n=1 Tax=Leeuwenhoekiella sp. MAR_2009_132 TaxID=1392489 RepID=UPI00068FE176|nr:DUF3127 domain-containing protein [Leeuwenhoekiella sp. MAR_2009_132]
MENTIVGQVKQIGPVETFGANGFRKRELILQTVEEYPQFIKVEFVQGNVELLDNLEAGQNIKVNYNLRGREHTNDAGEYNVFNSIVGWKIEQV